MYNVVIVIRENPCAPWDSRHQLYLRLKEDVVQQ